MPSDPLNMPSQRPAVFRADVDVSSGSAAPARLNAELKIENLLLEEYNYAGVSAYQALEDRARMFNLYLLLVGVVGSALGAVFQFAKPGDVIGLHGLESLAMTLLAVGGILGVVFFVKLIRLRAAYRESLIAMNAVKEYYIRHFRKSVPDIDSAFRWRLKSVPAGERWGSVTFLVCYTVGFLGSLCFAGAALVGTRIGQDVFLSVTVPLGTDGFPVLVAALVFAIALVLHVVYYTRKLNRRGEKELLIRLESEVDSGEAPIG